MSCYSAFTFDTFQNPHLRAIRLVRECALKYLSSGGPKTAGDQREESCFGEVQAAVLQACNP